MVKYFFKVIIKGKKVNTMVGQSNARLLFMSFGQRKNLRKYLAQVRRVLPNKVKRGYKKRRIVLRK